jgi:hypothetical protein
MTREEHIIRRFLKKEEYYCLHGSCEKCTVVIDGQGVHQVEVFLEEKYTELVACEHCEGRGIEWKDCPECNGTGEISETCEKCNGKKEIIDLESPPDSVVMVRKCC